MKKPHGRDLSLPWGSSCGSRIRTDDLEVMSLASYRAAPSRGVFLMSMPSLDVRSYLTTACYCQGIPAEECRHTPNDLVEHLIVLWCSIIHRIRDFRASFLSSHGVSCVPGFFCRIVEGHPSAAGYMNPLHFCLKARGERAV